MVLSCKFEGKRLKAVRLMKAARGGTAQILSICLFLLAFLKQSESAVGHHDYLHFSAFAKVAISIPSFHYSVTTAIFKETQVD